MSNKKKKKDKNSKLRVSKETVAGYRTMYCNVENGLYRTAIMELMKEGVITTPEKMRELASKFPYHIKPTELPDDYELVPQKEEQKLVNGDLTEYKEDIKENHL